MHLPVVRGFVLLIPLYITLNMDFLDKIYHLIFRNKKDDTYDLKELKANLRKNKEKESEEKTKIIIEEEIREIRLIVPSYTIKPDIPSNKKPEYYWNITCCKSCGSCFDSPGRPLHCVKKGVNNHFNGYCDDYTYNGIQLPE